ncbi:unnamed protein product [Staurois parvus]|uniref:Uncharacterized protein n=1 Tax=Staurois parvus TaxID=386267 RepID=A0ABN9FU62_9NEOB|nr:unnamed protein product [Staurois parvus]
MAVIRTQVWGDQDAGMGYGGDQDAGMGYGSDEDAGMGYGVIRMLVWGMG